jgi:hypothetical protein
MERHKEPGGPITVSQDVYDGIEAVRQSGLTNTLDRPMVRRLALAFGYDEAHAWIRDNPELYSRAIF